MTIPVKQSSSYDASVSQHPLPPLKTPTDTYKAFDKLLKNESFLDAKDSCCKCNILQLLLQVQFVNYLGVNQKVIFQTRILFAGCGQVQCAPLDGYWKRRHFEAKVNSQIKFPNKDGQLSRGVCRHQEEFRLRSQSRVKRHPGHID